jgi:hypothetical protein
MPPFRDHAWVRPEVIRKILRHANVATTQQSNIVVKSEVQLRGDEASFEADWP